MDYSKTTLKSASVAMNGTSASTITVNKKKQKGASDSILMIALSAKQLFTSLPLTIILLATACIIGKISLLFHASFQIFVLLKLLS